MLIVFGLVDAFFLLIENDYFLPFFFVYMK